MPSCRTSALLGALFSLVLGRSTHAAEQPLPTCDDLGLVYFPNDCISQCQDIQEEVQMKLSRDVNGLTKCYCTETPICNDDPLCAALLVIPGTADVGCSELCGSDASDVTVVDDVQFSDDPEAGNKNQTHFRVSCACDGVTRCGTDFVLFSDLTFLPSCSSGVDGSTLDVNSEEECTTYCLSYGFTASTYEDAACSCSNDDGTAVACSDAAANDDRGEFTDCFGEVGVSDVDCPTPSPAAAAASNPSGAASGAATPAGVGSWVAAVLSGCGSTVMLVLTMA